MACTTTLNIVEDNTAPDIQITIQRNGDTVALGTAPVDLILSLNGTIINAGHQACTIVSATNGIIQYTATAADFATAGDYLGDVRINYVGGRVEICRDQLQVDVRAKLA
jgi:hypothetical protein